MTLLEPDIPASLDRRPLVASYTLLNTYLNICPHQAAHRYIWKTVQFFETPEMKFGTEVHKAFEYRIGGGKPLPADFQKWEAFASVFDGRGAKAEMQLGMAADGANTGFFDKNVWLRGKLDVHIVNGDTAYLGDFKTGKVREDPFELEVQALLLMGRHRNLQTIKGQYFWLKEDRPGELHDLSDVSRTWQVARRAMACIAEDRKTGEFEKRKSGLCSWCPVETCENWRPRPT